MTNDLRKKIDYSIAPSCADGKREIQGIYEFYVG